MNARFEADVLANPKVAALLQGIGDELPHACLAGGCLFQSAWNAVHGFDATHGIADYDLFYFDADDLSAEAEHAASDRLTNRFASLGIELEVTNQARVHLWYEQTFGVPSRPFQSCEEGIDAFLGVACCVGLRRTATGLVTYAPHGLDDIYDLIVRPNPFRAAQGPSLRSAWQTKTARWSRIWPRLTVEPWPAEHTPA